MFGILSRLMARKPTPVSRTTRLSVEALEDRCCPSASSITLNAVVQASHMVSLTGSVMGDRIAGVNVMFSGAVTGSTTTDSNGNYGYTTSSALLGSVSAVCMELSNSTTDIAQATISVAAPSVTFSIASLSASSVTLTGKLTDIDPVGRSIVIGGDAFATTVTDSNGNFTLTTPLMGHMGTITASTTDLWGQASNSAQMSDSIAPDILNFSANRVFDNTWVFTGTVTGSNMAGAIITFGGLSSLAGQFATVNPDGTFSLTVIINPADLPGTATASVTDSLGNSDVASCTLT
jgi:hypothetical protein